LKYWEIIADNLHKAGWSLGWVSALDVEGRTIWIVMRKPERVGADTTLKSSLHFTF
jgi:hypothetical protein